MFLKCTARRFFDSSGYSAKRAATFILLLLLLNMMFFNVAIYFGFIRPVLVARKPGGLLYDLGRLSGNISFTEFLGRRKSLLRGGRDGGFASAIENTFGRVYMMSQDVPQEESKGKTNSSPNTISFFGLDVSHSLEASYIYRRILQRRAFHVTRLIVDIGANDGLISSNSMNFIHWGWSAILVEPQGDILEMAKKNTKSFRDPYNEGKQRVDFVQAVIGPTDGRVKLAVPGDNVKMESFLITDRRKWEKKTIEVPSMTVETFAKNLHIPKRFGILSIDAEGVGDRILHQFIDAGFRPAYVIYEAMHNKEDSMETTKYMEKAGYRFLTQKGWNTIYELKL